MCVGCGGGKAVGLVARAGFIVGSEQGGIHEVAQALGFACRACAGLCLLGLAGCAAGGEGEGGEGEGEGFELHDFLFRFEVEYGE